MNIYETKVYRRISGSVCDDKKENWRVLTNKAINAIVKKPTITETIRLNRLRWFGYVQRMEVNRIMCEFGKNKIERYTKKQMAR
jgi:hypothetical protein